MTTRRALTALSPTLAALVACVVGLGGGVVMLVFNGGAGALVPWFGFVTVSGLAGSIAGGTLRAVDDVKADTAAIRNGEMEHKIRRVVGVELARHSADLDHRIDRKLDAAAELIVDRVCERLAS